MKVPAEIFRTYDIRGIVGRTLTPPIVRYLRRLNAISEADLKAYIRASYKMIAGSLTKKLRAELGLTEL